MNIEHDRDFQHLMGSMDTTDEYTQDIRTGTAVFIDVSEKFPGSVVSQGVALADHMNQHPDILSCLIETAYSPEAVHFIQKKALERHVHSDLAQQQNVTEAKVAEIMFQDALFAARAQYISPDARKELHTQYRDYRRRKEDVEMREQLLAAALHRICSVEGVEITGQRQLNDIRYGFDVVFSNGPVSYRNSPHRQVMNTLYWQVIGRNHTALGTDESTRFYPDFPQWKPQLATYPWNFLFVPATAAGRQELQDAIAAVKGWADPIARRHDTIRTFVTALDTLHMKCLAVPVSGEQLSP